MFSSILLQTDSDKDITLLNTSKILCTKDLSTTNNRFIYTVSDKLRIYRLNPYSLVEEIEIKLKVDLILVIKNDIFYVGEGRLIKNMKENISLQESVFGISNVEDKVGVQFADKLVLYDFDLNKVKEYKCTSSFYVDGVLLLGYKNHLQIITRSALDIYLEDDITCITCDILFSRIFCGSTSGKIYQINMDGTPNKILDYHETSVKFVKMSMCDRFLYSADESGLLLIWEDVVVDRVKLDNIKGLEVYI
ncbi:WD40 repeat domain-containing protein [Vairimorpha necatrix]|uniref:WD40 repeat domain-containing protein n=1 Tax=Vairimorpha necatrix TaxID=6039 RepID=A0AAX4JEJ7_9MICR